MKKKRSPLMVFLTCVLAVPTVGWLMGDLVWQDGLSSEAMMALFRPWLATGVLLGGAHLLIRPILRVLSAPLGCLTLGLFGLVIDVGLIYAAAYFVDGFRLSSPLSVILTAVLINIINAVTQ